MTSRGGVVSAAAGAIVSTAEDMCKWLLFHIREGKNEDGIQVVPKADLDYTYVPQNVAQWRGSFTLNRYSLGWYNGYYKGTLLILHLVMVSLVHYLKYLCFTCDKKIIELKYGSFHVSLLQWK